MKKIVLCFIFLCITGFALGSTSDIISNEEVARIQHRIDEVGFKLLNSNGIEYRTTFNFNIKRVKNAYSTHRNREIVIFRDLYNRLGSDDELAYVLGHEISHSVDSYNGIFRGFYSAVPAYFSPKKYEYKADKRAIDYMVQAGYNPVAGIVAMSKIFPQERFDWCSSHPLASRRMIEVYEYIYRKYPEFLANNSYKNNPYYQNFLLTSKENRLKFQDKIKSNKKVKYL